MERPDSTYLYEAILQALAVDITTSVAPAEHLDCCPIVAYTTERNIALGRFRGSICLPQLKDLQSALNFLVTENVVKVIVDLAAVSFSHTAMGVLVSFAATMHGRQKRLYLYNPSDQIMHLLHELHLESYFTYLYTQDDVIASLVV